MQKKLKKTVSIILILSSSLVKIFAAPIAYENYQYILKKYLNNKSAVNYKNLDITKLNNIIRSFEEFTFEEYSNLNKQEQLIFWIEAYNAFMIKIGYNNYPIKRDFFDFFLYPKKSIQNIGNIDKKIVKIFNDKITLKNIRNKIIEMDSPRSLFALTTLAKTSPNLKNSLYNKNLLPRDLDEQVIKFIFNKKNYFLDRKIGVLYLSPIFKKYSEIFKIYNKNLPFFLTEEENKIINFLLKYVRLKDETYLQTASFYQIIYYDFDWTLNSFTIKESIDELLK
ncbi:MAG: DUF547 domain-containing protein [bacterium]|nr:DUF547 domain-containing protein [bacterium]